MTDGASARFAGHMGRLLGPDFPATLGLAVSGGGDSMALLALTHNWTRAWGIALRVATVDHGLRPEAGAEAAMVAGECATLGWPHATLSWRWDGTGNLQDAARRGRLSALARWAAAEGLTHVMMAHTRDDQAETVLMRLARGSGVEGLSGMAERHRDAASGLEIVRPLLRETRAELRHVLRVLKVPFAEDPSNDDPRYERVRIRRALDLLEAEGISRADLAETATRMRAAREALSARAVAVWDAIGVEEARTGQLVIDRDGYAAIERDTRERLLAQALRYVSGAAYRPRQAPLAALDTRILAGGSGTLSGCEVVTERARLRILREFACVAGAVAPPDRIWDGLWRLDAAPEATEGCEIRALGETGWQSARATRPETSSHRAARVLPALWRGDRPVHCPAVGLDHPGCGPFDPVTPSGASRSFRDRLLSH